MKLRREDAEALVDIIADIAKAIVDDQEYRHSDYAGMDTDRAKKRAVEKLTNGPE